MLSGSIECCLVRMNVTSYPVGNPVKQIILEKCVQIFIFCSQFRFQTNYKGMLICFKRSISHDQITTHKTHSKQKLVQGFKQLFFKCYNVYRVLFHQISLLDGQHFKYVLSTPQTSASNQNYFICYLEWILKTSQCFCEAMMKTITYRHKRLKTSSL